MEEKLTKGNIWTWYTLEYIRETGEEVSAIIQDIYDGNIDHLERTVASYEVDGMDSNELHDNLTKEILAKFKELEKKQEGVE